MRVHLEFSASVWSPWTWELVEECEAVQRRSTRMLMGMDGLSYEQRLRVLKLPTLIFRRIRGDLINVYKYVHGIYDSKLVSLNFDDGETRGHDYKLKKTRCRLNLAKYFFANRVVNWWNELPQEIVSATSVHSFEARFDKFYMNHPLKYDYRFYDNPVPSKLR